MRGAGACLCVLLAAGPAMADGIAGLGTLESESVQQALADRGLRIDPTPQGKTVGAIFVVNQEVFSAKDWIFRLLNVFHRVTREHAVEREVLMRPGHIYDPALVEETIRNLKDPSLSSVVVVLPVEASRPGTVDVLVVTRDVWSLRLNTDFEYQAGKLIFFTGSLSENNLFGWRKHAAMVFVLDQGEMAVGPTYVDSNIAGTRLRLVASARALFARQDGVFEGTSSATSLAYPLFSLASRWGVRISVSHGEGVVRTFAGNNVALVDLKATPETEALPWLYHSRRFNTGASVTRSFGKRVIQRVALGHAFSVRRPSFTNDFPVDPVVRDAFAAEFFPRSERLSEVFAEYSMFTPRYRTYRDLNTFDLSEDVQLGPSFSTWFSGVASALGADSNFVATGASGAWALDLAGGYQSISASWNTRVKESKITDENISFGAYAATPILANRLRLVASGEGGVLINDTLNARYFLGGGNGLRGYAVGDFTGRAQFTAHAEARSMPVNVSSLRLGALAFYDVGHAAATAADWVPHHDVGLGLRLLIPQLNTYVLRCDWAFALQDGPHTKAGWPGRVSVGFRQVF